MSDQTISIRSIAVAAHPQVSEAIEESIQISTLLEENGVASAYGLLYDESLRQRVKAGEFSRMWPGRAWTRAWKRPVAR